MLLACAVVLAVGQLLIENPSLPVLAVTTLVPMVIATRVVNTPGAASAVCGAYLMPRAIVSLIHPETQLPPLLLVPAFAFDAVLWLRTGDLRRWFGRTSRWRKRIAPALRKATWQRAALAGAVFGLVLSAVAAIPSFDLVTILVSSVVAQVSVRDTAT